METDATQFPLKKTATPSSKTIWAARFISGLPVLFLLVDGIMKLFKPDVVVTATRDLGYPESTIVPIGLTLTASTLLYIAPRTSVLGAIFLTGYLGGAVATHVRVEAQAFNLAFPVIVGTLLWLGLYLRDGRLRQLIPLKH